ncbi:Sulfotransferase family [Seminavis robusta]|uniref:Sulfotransferase family n=1 Tax=Seminavis robusta TaxID=568900 RepID=A0A9N8ELC4_9STRA|nr:Sulfotransferase family [Seminavis robusta]|eukprot:Sro1157_g247330.1 Sulfotransferase family (318) ;mRNA; r:4343-5379
MMLAMPLTKAFVSTKKLLGVLVFISVCLAFQGLAVVLFNSRVHQNEDHVLNRPVRIPDNFHVEKAKSLSYVMQLKSTRRTLKFFHIPKAAGTAIEHVGGAQMNLPWGSCLFKHYPKRTICTYPPSNFEWPRNYGWWHLPAQLFPMGGSNPYEGAELFAIIRDPFDRLVSEFYYICQLRVFEWRPDQCNRNRLFEKDYMNEWLQNKLSHKDFDKAKTYLQDNGHFTPQYNFLVTKNQVRMVDYVMSMDELPTQFAGLMDAYSLRIKMAKKKINAARNSTTHLEPKDLDSVTVKSIQKVFRHDFDLSPLFERNPWKKTA